MLFVANLDGMWKLLLRTSPKISFPLSQSWSQMAQESVGCGWMTRVCGGVFFSVKL